LPEIQTGCGGVSDTLSTAETSRFDNASYMENNVTSEKATPQEARRMKAQEGLF
jgi:hypothetical protein